MSGHEPIGDVVSSKSQRQLWHRAADGRRVRRQLLIIADATERVAVATVRSCYQAGIGDHDNELIRVCCTRLRNARQPHAHKTFASRAGPGRCQIGSREDDREPQADLLEHHFLKSFTRAQMSSSDVANQAGIIFGAADAVPYG
jgi:hypothetical protein